MRPCSRQVAKATLLLALLLLADVCAFPLADQDDLAVPVQEVEGRPGLVAPDWPGFKVIVLADRVENARIPVPVERMAKTYADAFKAAGLPE